MRTPLVTIECARPGEVYLLFKHGPNLSVHLAPVLSGRFGGTGACLCGYDRFGSGFSVGGGYSGPDIHHDVCGPCLKAAPEGSPIIGMHADLFKQERES
jgi:hypothetical protein